MDRVADVTLDIDACMGMMAAAADDCPKPGFYPTPGSDASRVNMSRPTAVWA